MIIAEPLNRKFSEIDVEKRYVSTNTINDSTEKAECKPNALSSPHSIAFHLQDPDIKPENMVKAFQQADEDLHNTRYYNLS